MALEPPRLDGPSLTSLRAFEAAARLGSFRRAAVELHVTPAAVAQHVKAIERWAEQPLFERTARGVVLTEAGARSRPELTAAFQALSRATAMLRDGDTGPRTIRVAALPAVAQLWLTPRLPELSALVPDASISINALDHRPDLDDSAFDVVAYYEPSSGDCDELVLVAAPRVAATLDTVEALRGSVALVDRTWDRHWGAWLGGRAELLDDVTSVEFTLFAMAVDAARRGDGVLVGRLSLLSWLVESGELVEPFDHRVATHDALAIHVRSELGLAALADWAARIS